jgi:hypothetical protein
MTKFVTCEIRQLEFFNLYSANGKPTVRIRATVVKDHIGRFDPDDWVLTSAVVGSEQGDGFMDYLTHSGSRYRTVDTPEQGRDFHFKIRVDLVNNMLLGGRGDTLTALHPDAVVGSCANG